MIWKYEDKFWSNLKDAICFQQIALTQRWDDDLKIWREVLIIWTSRCNFFFPINFLDSWRWDDLKKYKDIIGFDQNLESQKAMWERF
jgi:hypothetical protein